MKIAITGSTGFVGAAMVRHFAAKGHEVFALGRTSNPPTALTQKSTYIKSDISQSVPKMECDVCIHVAALATDKAPYSQFLETNYLGTKRVFESIRCKKFIQISTSSVYHFANSVHTEAEEIPIDKLSDYGKTKRLAEEFLIKEKNKGTAIFILRPRGIYGIGDRVLLPRILNMGKGKTIRLPGSLKVDCSFTHIDNLIQAAERSMNSDFDFRIYNVADEPTYQLRDGIETLINGAYEKPKKVQEINLSLIKFLAKTFHLLRIPTRLTPLFVQTITQPNVLNIEKIKRELNYQPTQDFQKATPEIFEWVKKVGLEKVLRADKDLPWEGV